MTVLKIKFWGLKTSDHRFQRRSGEEKNNPTRIPKEFLSKRVHLPIEPKVTDLLRRLNKIEKSKTTEINKIFQNAYRKYTIDNIQTFEEFLKYYLITQALR